MAVYRYEEKSKMSLLLSVFLGSASLCSWKYREETSINIDNDDCELHILQNAQLTIM